MGGSTQNPGDFNSNVVDIPAVDATGAGIGIVAYGAGTGIQVSSDSGAGIQATYTGGTAAGTAIVGTSYSGYGITGEGGNIGIYAHNRTTPGIAVYLATTGLAGDFYGDVNVSGKVTVGGDVILTGADCAEEFDVAESGEIEPGTVMVLAHDGALHQSQQAYDKRVAGVISGAGAYRPGMIFDRQQTQVNRLPLALVGKVYCKVDALYAPIDIGDLLTTSPTPGHDMKADDPLKAFGAVIGKALRPLEAGQGLIPILIALQ
jgi:hypothetical protein